MDCFVAGVGTWDVDADFRICQGGPGGDQIGPTKRAQALYQSVTCGLVGVSYAPGEVPFTAGNTYYIEMSPAPGSASFVAYKFHDQSKNGYPYGDAYWNGIIQPNVDLEMTIIEYKPWWSSATVNPSFEDYGGTLDGWKIDLLGGEGPDDPPLHNTNPYGPQTPFGDHFAGKVTSWLTMDFRLGQIIEVADYDPTNTSAAWSLSAHVNMHSHTGTDEFPENVHQVWEIGWNDDGSVPASVNRCDNYQVVASIDGHYTGNDSHNFYPLSASGFITDVIGLRYVVSRVRIFNDAGREWSMNNIDNVVFDVAARMPEVRPEAGTLIFQDGRIYPDQTTYAGTRDAHILQEHALYNTGGHDVLEAARYTGSNSGHDRSVVVKFTALDTSSEAGKVLQQATLTLDYFGARNDPGGVAKTLYVHKLLHDWGEGTKTGIDGGWAGANEVCWTKPYGATGGENPNWNGTLDDQYADPVALDSVALNSGQYGPANFDVTEAVQEHLVNPSQNFGFVIREEQGSESTQDGTRQFHSREATVIADRPALTSTFVDQPPPVMIESVASMADHGAAGELGLNVNLTASSLPADSALVTTESREEGITKLVIDCDGNVMLPGAPEDAVESIVGVNSGDVTANVVNVTAVADVITITLNAMPDQDTYTVTLSSLVIAGDNDFMVRALRGEVDNGGASSQVVNALDLSDVRMHFTDDVTVGDNAKYDIVSDGAINALDLSDCRLQFTHTAP